MGNILKFIVQSIVDNPDSVSIEESEKDGIIQFTITADASDYGKIIGKEGKIIRAIRNVLKIPAIKQEKRINISLSETSQS